MIAGGAALVGAAPRVPDLDGMDWDAGGIIGAGSAEQEEAEPDVVRAAAELAGVPHLHREAATLRSAAARAMSAKHVSPAATHALPMPSAQGVAHLAWVSAKLKP